MTSTIPVTGLKGNIFGHTIYTSSVTVISFMLAKLWRGDGNGICIPHFLYIYIQMRFTFLSLQGKISES